MRPYEVTLDIQEAPGQHGRWTLIRRDRHSPTTHVQILGVFDSAQAASARMKKVASEMDWKFDALRKGSTILAMAFGWHIDGVGKPGFGDRGGFSGLLRLDALCIRTNRFDRISGGDVIDGYQLQVELARAVTHWDPTVAFASHEACNPSITPTLQQQGLNL